jgi:hypothetical protein
MPALLAAVISEGGCVLPGAVWGLPVIASPHPALAWTATIGLPLALYAIGSRVALRLTTPEGEESGAGPGYRTTLALLAGLVGFHLALLLLDAAGIPWTRTTLLAALLLLGASAWVLARRLPSPASSPWGRPTLAPGWGDLAAFAALLAFLLLATTLWITLPDFYYHWGLKAERFALAGGFDEAWLARSWNSAIHPDYPNLLPGLYAATAILGGGFAAPPLMLWSAIFFGLILATAHDALRRAGVERSLQQGTVAFLGLAVAAYGIGYRMAGGADWTIALALIAAAPPLFTRIETLTWRADLQIGLAAAFAAGAKMEGVPLAAFLMAIHAARRLPQGTRAPARSFLLTALLPAALLLPWLLQIRRGGLFQASNAAPFDPARIRPVAAAMWEAMAAPELHGLPWLILLLPLLLLTRRTRPLAAVCAAQLLFYLWAYLASDLEPRFYVLSNFARLLFHLLPATVLGSVIATSSPDRRLA